MCLKEGEIERPRKREKQGWQDGQGENAAADCYMSALF